MCVIQKTVYEIYCTCICTILQLEKIRFINFINESISSDLKILSGESLKWRLVIKYLGVTFGEIRRWGPSH